MVSALAGDDHPLGKLAIVAVYPGAAIRAEVQVVGLQTTAAQSRGHGEGGAAVEREAAVSALPAASRQSSHHQRLHDTRTGSLVPRCARSSECGDGEGLLVTTAAVELVLPGARGVAEEVERPAGLNDGGRRRHDGGGRRKQAGHEEYGHHPRGARYLAAGEGNPGSALGHGPSARPESTPKCLAEQDLGSVRSISSSPGCRSNVHSVNTA